ncbi:helix-turn-helix transcriptional regulator [Erwinia persicina]|uniref:Helix-turn-helix transcriptional regulator n=1 Tax=Erwinia persicina TaxID=55211 RepID=A0A4U3FF61_9GAMM|nr:LuxR C-terminal-related transcriptional regulator [Erwinia persicina]MBD8107914.1 helix-turn-helix transcriptional regulator [Erwinia persicina]MBD8169295.1 helix-turn-helix transcriptional regulator [Erwinia persicina]MBD8210994.1 helix-turn-helix transcriptional regulator [Erwinia persicina]TKJ92493.1 helix-turn-helix transcriptional regulator [Erwinia persicina]
MKSHIDIVILDNDQYFSQGLEALLASYFIRVGCTTAFLPAQHYWKADLVFQQQNLNQTAQYCHRQPAHYQSLITIQEPVPPGYRQRLVPCLSEKSVINRLISTGALLNEVERIMKHDTPAAQPWACPRCALTLTLREKQVLLAIRRAQSPGQIATELKLSVKTISAHKWSAMKKLGFKRNTELLNWLRQGDLRDELSTLL